MKHWLGRKTNASSSVLRILRFEMSEWVIQWSWSINANAIPLGNIHTVHDCFMGVAGNSLLPFDSMDSEWKQNHWRNQGKQCVTFLSCPLVFHRLMCIPHEKGGKVSPLLIQARLLLPKTANSEVNHTCPPASYPEYGKYEWEWSNSVLKRSQGTECLYKLDCFWHL